MKSWTRVEDQDLEWKITRYGCSLIINDEKFRVKEAKLYANGTKDLRIVLVDDNLEIRKIENCTNLEIIHVPDNDIMQIEFDKDLPLPHVGRFSLIEITEEMVPFVTELTHRFGKEKGDLYDAYLGRNYWRSSNKSGSK